MTSRNLFIASVFAFAACGGKSGTTGVNTTKDLGGFLNSDGSTSSNNDGSSSGTNDGSTSGTNDGGTVTPPPAGSNQVSVVIDTGVTGAQQPSANVGFVTIKLCAPGSTTNCGTIDHISVDTGSVGLRVISSSIPSAVLAALPVTQSGGKSVTECYGYADGFVFGTVRTADFTLGGETVAAMPFHAIGDKSVGSVPKSCSSFGSEEDDVNTFGGNGIIGIAPYAPDCTSCTTASSQGNPIYYTCSGSVCTAAGIPQASQLSNPVSLFATDNNGEILSFSDPGDAPSGPLTGTLTFGIGTQSNNALPSGLQTYKIGDINSNDYLNITAGTVAGKACTDGTFFDSGTNFVGFDDSALKQCTQEQGFYCPASTTAVAYTLTDASNNKNASTYNVGNAETIFQNAADTDAVFKAVVSEGGGYCDWGLPFFYGKNMYVGIEGTTVTGATTPFEAF